MKMQSIAKICLLGSALALSACDKGEDKDTKAKAGDKAAAKAPGDAKEPGDVKAPGDVEVVEDGKAAPADEAFDERVVKAAGLAQKIEADPARADEILAEAGMDRVAFDALIYEVSSKELAEQYRLARAREDG